TRSVRKRKKNVALRQSTTGRVSTTPRTKSGICLGKARIASVCDFQSAPGTLSERKFRMNSPVGKIKQIIAATIWLRVNADAKQPNEINMQPINKIPRNVLPTAPASKAAESLE